MADDESEQAKLARNLSELLQELRVAQAGVQILFAFLLSVTFAARFGQATSVQRITLIVTILLTTLSAVLLMAPAAWHRIYFRRGRRVDVIRWGSRCALAGMLLLGAAMSGAVLVTTATVVGTGFGIVLAGCTAVVFAAVWLGVPFVRRRDSDDAEDPPRHSRHTDDVLLSDQGSNVGRDQRG